MPAYVLNAPQYTEALPSSSMITATTIDDFGEPGDRLNVTFVIPGAAEKVGDAVGCDEGSALGFIVGFIVGVLVVGLIICLVVGAVV